VTVEVVFAGIPVADYATGREWYERLFGRPPDMFPNDNEVVWQVAGAGCVYVVVDTERVGNGLLTLIVDDLDAQVAALAERGHATDPIVTLPGLVRKAQITDPDGNRVTFGEPLGES
jgi:predicted enzyme related to lactoylglutathione lyase